MTAGETTLLTGDVEVAAAQAFVFGETVDQIAANWKAIICVGSLNLMTGIGCLLFPVFATQVAEIFLISLIFSIGLLNVLAICVGASGDGSPQQNSIFWLGCLQILLALLMYMNPFFTLTIMTFCVAVTFMVLGGVQIGLARHYRDQMAARALMTLSGTLAVLMSIIICLSMPTAQWFTIGVLMGVNLINVGMNRIVVGLYGRKIAQNEDSESWRSYLDADLV